MHALLDPIDKPGLLIAVMRVLAGPSTRISLEGDLEAYPIDQLEDCSGTETGPLRRNTISPMQDFVIAPLTEHNLEVIKRMVSVKNGISRNSGLLHVQISRGENLAFGAYDNFHSECVITRDEEIISVLQSLKDRSMIRAFRVEQQ